MIYRKRFIILLLLIILFHGCAGSDKRLDVNQLQQIDSVKVVLHKTPSLMKETSASQTALMTGIMFGAIGGAIGGAISVVAEAKAGEEVAEKCNLPDFGEIVLNKFKENLDKKMTGWPRIELEKNPIDDTFISNSGCKLILNVRNMRLANGIGFSTATTAQLIDYNKNVLWKRTMSYTSKKFNRFKTLKELEADNCKLLHEEFDYAAENTVSDFIAHLKGEIDEVKKLEEKSAFNQDSNIIPNSL